MIDKLINKLLKEGKIKKQKVGIIQIEELLKDALLDLKEAKRIVQFAERATYIQSYVANA